MVGGDITIQGNNGRLTDFSIPTLGVAGGQIHLASVAAAGEVPVNLLDFNMDTFARLGRLEISQGAFLKASGNGGGIVFLRGGHLRIDRSNIFADNLGTRDGTGLGIDLQIVADAIVTNRAALTTDTVGVEAGRARDLRLTAGSLRIDDSFVHSEAFSAVGSGVILANGRGGGDVTITATDAIAISHSPVISVGAVSISAPTVHINNAAIGMPNFSGFGRAGDIVIEARQLTLTDNASIGSNSTSARRAGDVTIKVDRLTLTRGAIISSSTGGIGVFGTGPGGRITITATDVMAIAGQISGLFTKVRSCGLGGDITLQAREVQLTGGARISGITFGAGHGGNVTVTATDMIIIAGRDRFGSPSELSSSTGAQGQGGNVHVQARTIELRDRGMITASSTSDGVAGTLLLQAGDIFRSQHGAVTTAADRAGGARSRCALGG
jgi:hypothetical protein